MFEYFLQNCIKGQPFDQHFHLLLNVAIGGDFLDNPTENTTWDYPDAEMIVDYVKVYKLQVSSKPDSNTFSFEKSE